MSIESNSSTACKINEIDFEDKAFKRSRGAAVSTAALEYFVAILVSDAFLAKLLTNIGMSDALIGIVSSLISFSFLFQLLSIFLAKKIKNVKKTCITIFTIHQFFFMFLYIIPFLPLSVDVKTFLVFASIIGAYAINYTVSSIISKWVNSYVDPRSRGRFSAGKEIVSLLGGIVFTLIVGKIVDKFESVGNINGAFIFISISIFVLIIGNFISLMMVKDGEVKLDNSEPKELPLKDIIKNTLGNKNFVNVIIMTVLWDVARCSLAGFLGVYKTNDLLLTVGTVQIINMAGSLMRMAFSIPFGKYSDKHSYASGMKLALLLISVAFLTMIFTTPKTKWLIIAYTVIYNVSFAGINANGSNIAYSYVKIDYLVPAMALKNSIGGICGFLSALGAGKFLSYVQSNGNMLFGFHVYGQQVLAAFSFVLTIITVLFIKFVIEKQKVIVQ